MVRWVFNKFKRRIRRHLEREAILITEINEACRSGRLTLDEMVKLTNYIVSLARELAEKYLAYNKGVKSMPLAMKLFLPKVFLQKQRRGG